MSQPRHIIICVYARQVVKASFQVHIIVVMPVGNHFRMERLLPFTVMLSARLILLY